MRTDEKIARFGGMRKPPVIEAVIDIVTDDVMTVEQLDNLNIPSLEDEFPERQVINIFSGMISSENGGTASSDVSFLGYMNKSRDGQLIVQTRLNGFAYNVLYPYESWDIFIDQALKYWELFRGARGASNIKQIGLRYINVINDVIENSKIFDIGNSIFNSPFGDVEFANCQYQINSNKYASVATINMMMQPVSHSSERLVFDIDVKKSISQKCSDTDEVVKILTELRAFKNELFFGTLSVEQLEKFK